MIELTVPIVNNEKVFNKSLEISCYNEILARYSGASELINLFRIDVLMVYTEGEYESYKDWYKLKKPKYIESKKSFVVEVFLQNEQLNKFINSTKEDGFKILSNLIIDTIESCILPKKVKDFDKERFKADVEEFFREQHLI